MYVSIKSYTFKETILLIFESGFYSAIVLQQNIKLWIKRIKYKSFDQGFVTKSLFNTDLIKSFLVQVIGLEKVLVKIL